MVTSMLMYTSRRLSNVSRSIPGRLAKFGGPSLHSFEVIQLFSEGEGRAQKPLPVLNRAKEHTRKQDTMG